MKKVTLKRLRAENFKSFVEIKWDFAPEGAEISGRNEAGKSSIYDAYLWCLFGTTTRNNDCVQPIGEDNRIRHKIDTTVEVVLDVDGAEVKVARVLSEKWKADGLNEKFLGTEVKRFYNDVPCSVKDFEAKLNDICPTDRWLMLSNIGTFMAQKMENRRNLLNQIANGFDATELAKPYLAVSAAFEQRKTIVELEKQVKDTKKRAEAEIKNILTQIAAQDRLKVDEDFDSIRKEKEDVERQIADLDKQLQASPEELAAEKGRKDKILAAESRLFELRKAWNDAHFRALQDLEVQRLNAQEAVKTLQEQDKADRKKQAEMEQKRALLLQEFEDKKYSWMSLNKEEFTWVERTVCDYCGQPISEEAQIRLRNEAVNEFNTEKAERLQALYNKCAEIKQRIKVLDTSIEETQNAIVERAKHLTNADREMMNSAQAKLKVMEKSIDQDEEIKAAEAEYNRLKSAVPQQRNTTDIAQRKAALEAQRDALIKRLAAEQTNAKVEAEKQRLNQEATRQAQIVADQDAVLHQIKLYKRDVIERTEGSTNRFFRMVNWKFAEQNKTNDDEKPFCTPLYRGIEYDRQNNASRVNMGIDICCGLMRGFSTLLPLFVDNVESVQTLIPTDTQLIRLRFVADEKLTFRNLE